MSTIRLIVGLGNPGTRYHWTRHNIGQQLVHALCQDHLITLRQEKKLMGSVALLPHQHPPCYLFCPSHYMNESGFAVQCIMHFYRLTPAEILIVHDELDLPCGHVQLKQGGGHAGHNGLRHIIQVLHSTDFKRCRIGIAHPQDKSAVADYVLSRPNTSEKIALEMAIERIIATLPLLLRGDWQQAQQALHGISE